MEKLMAIALGLAATLVALQLAQAQQCIMKTCGPKDGKYTQMCDQLCRAAGYERSNCFHDPGLHHAGCSCLGSNGLRDTSDLETKCDEMCPQACQSCGHSTGACWTQKDRDMFMGICQ